MHGLSNGKVTHEFITQLATYLFVCITLNFSTFHMSVVGRKIIEFCFKIKYSRSMETQSTLRKFGNRWCYSFCFVHEDLKCFQVGLTAENASLNQPRRLWMNIWVLLEHFLNALKYQHCLEGSFIKHCERRFTRMVKIQSPTLIICKTKSD